MKRLLPLESRKDTREMDCCKANGNATEQRTILIIMLTARNAARQKYNGMCKRGRRGHIICKTEGNIRI